jgi:hypothetical protein
MVHLNWPFALLLGAVNVLPAIAQNHTIPNLNATIHNATLFSSPSHNISTILIEYAPSTVQINGSQQYTINFPPIRRRVTYYVYAGLAIIDGDIVFGTEAELLAHRVPEGNIPSKRGEEYAGHIQRRSLSFLRDDVRKWPNGEIEYYWESDATRIIRETDFLDAIRVWTDRLPFLKFTYRGISPTTTQNGPIVLKLGTDSVSSSPVGRADTAGGNYMVLGNIGSGASRSLGVYIHEIGHSKLAHHCSLYYRT